MKSCLAVFAGVVFTATAFGSAQSPKATETATIGGKSVSIVYFAPSVRGRQLFGDGGLISHDPNYPVWRAGADFATILNTDSDVEIGGLLVPKGTHSLYVNIKDPNNWELIVNKQTGQWGLDYDMGQDVGRVKMTMSKPASPVEVLKYTLSSTGGNKGTLRLAWENHVGTVPVTVK